MRFLLQGLSYSLFDRHHPLHCRGIYVTAYYPYTSALFTPLGSNLYAPILEPPISRGITALEEGESSPLRAKEKLD